MNFYCIVTNIEPKEDRLGNPGKLLTLNEVTFLANGATVFTMKSCRKWISGGGKYLTRVKDSSGKEFDKEIEIQKSAYYDTIKVGQLILGEIKTFQTTTYSVNGREVTKWSGLVLKDEDPITVCQQATGATVLTNNTVNQLPSVQAQVQPEPNEVW